MVWSIYEIIQMWTAVVDESEEWSSKLIFQFKQLEIKKKPEKNQGFNRDTGAMLYQLSYESTHWERGQFIEFLSPVRRQSQSIYEYFAFTIQPNTLKGWGMGALVTQAQDMFNCDNKLTTKWIRDTSSNVLHAPKPDP